jgi:hypothetical protein
MPGIMAAFDMWRSSDIARSGRLTRQEMQALWDSGATHLVVDLHWDVTETRGGVYRWDFYDDYMEAARTVRWPIVARFPWSSPHDMTSRIWSSQVADYCPNMADPRSVENQQRLVAWLKAAHMRYHFDIYETGGGYQAEGALCSGMPYANGLMPAESLEHDDRSLADLIVSFVEWLDLCVSTAGQLAGEVWIPHVVYDTISAATVSAGTLGINALLLFRVPGWSRQFRIIHDFHEFVDANQYATQLIRHLGGYSPAIIGAQSVTGAEQYAQIALRSGMVGLICWAKYRIFGPTAVPGALRMFERAATAIHTGVDHVFDPVFA